MGRDDEALSSDERAFSVEPVHDDAEHDAALLLCPGSRRPSQGRAGSPIARPKAGSRSQPAQANSAFRERQSTTGPRSFPSFLTPKGRPRVSPCYSGNAETSISPRRARATRPRPCSGSRTGLARASGASLTGRTCPSRSSAARMAARSRSRRSCARSSTRRQALDNRRGGLAPCCKRADQCLLKKGRKPCSFSCAFRDVL